MSFTNPINTDFKNFFVRDFPYGTDPATSILDSDIDKAIFKASININPALFGDQASYTLAFEQLTAHYLVMDMRSSSQGISGKVEWPVNSKSVGVVSESFSIPQRILDNPMMAYLAQTSYGCDYLMMVLPLLTGQMFIVEGGTTA